MWVPCLPKKTSDCCPRWFLCYGAGTAAFPTSTSLFCKGELLPSSGFGKVAPIPGRSSSIKGVFSNETEAGQSFVKVSVRLTPRAQEQVFRLLIPPLSASISLPYLTGAFIALDCSPLIQRLNLPLCLCFRAICCLENSASVEYNKCRHIWPSCRGFWDFFYFIFLPLGDRSWSRCNLNFSCSDMLQLPLQQGRLRRVSRVQVCCI